MTKNLDFGWNNYLLNRNKKSIEKGCFSILNLGQYSIQLFDSVVSEVASNPEEVEYYQEPFINTQKKVSEQNIQKQILNYSIIKKFGGDFKFLTK